MTTLEAALVCARWLLLATELQLLGALAAVTWAGRYPLWPVLRPAFCLLAVAGPVWLVLQAIAIGEPSDASEAARVLGLVLTATQVGHTAILRALCWAVCFAIARHNPAWAILPAGAAVALHGDVGHLAALGDALPVLALVLHLLAAGVWLGGLLPLRLALQGADPVRIARRFSAVGLACVAVIGATAIVQAAVLAGGLPGLAGTDYGHVLLIKLAVFGMLLALAARHRFALSPRLATSPRALNRSLGLEIVLAAALLAAASLLASLPPGAHEQPNWPFPLRPSLDVLADDDLRAEIGAALLQLATAGALLFIATLHRRLHLAAPVAAIALAWFALPSLRLLLVPAEPTTYWQSPSAHDAASIARGAASFQRHCVACHGSRGAGDGKLAASLPIPPANLTAPHFWDHSDGTLFWWISHGMAAPDGQTVMPGLTTIVGDTAIWELIDFLHANNANSFVLPSAPHRHQRMMILE